MIYETGLSDMFDEARRMTKRQVYINFTVKYFVKQFLCILVGLSNPKFSYDHFLGSHDLERAYVLDWKRVSYSCGP